MTRKAYIAHLDYHTRPIVSYAKWRRERIYKAIISDHYKVPTDDLESDKTARLDRKKHDLVDSMEISVKELKAINEDSRTQQQRDKLAEQQARQDEKKRAKEEKKRLKLERKSLEKNGQVLKQKTARKPPVMRKVRMEKHVSGIPEARIENRPNMNRQRTAIDDLFDKLSNEKVN
jgi:cell division protein FtsL